MRESSIFKKSKKTEMGDKTAGFNNTLCVILKDDMATGLAPNYQK